MVWMCPLYPHKRVGQYLEKKKSNYSFNLLTEKMLLVLLDIFVIQGTMKDLTYEPQWNELRKSTT